jgi:glycosyltransferase involved in cell wall biosynthesis
MRSNEIHLISNFRALDRVLPAGRAVKFEHVPDFKGLHGAWGFVRQCARADVVVLNIDQQKLMLACLLRWVCPWLRFKLVSVDLIMRSPKTAAGHLKALLKRVLFSRVNRFILYFKNLDGYERFYGIGPDRAVYVPFKVNGWERLAAREGDLPDGDYVLCSGRTLRDIETFVEAMRRVDCPGVLLQQRRELLDAHGTAAWSGDLPPNVRLVIDDSDSLEKYIDFISRARLMVIPRYRGDIAPTGISTYLVAMALRKCVIISEGPGAGDVLSDQAVIVPPEDPARLAESIELMWGDDRLRSEMAARGSRYAQSLEGEDRLFADILRLSLLTLEDGHGGFEKKGDLAG